MLFADFATIKIEESKVDPNDSVDVIVNRSMGGLVIRIAALQQRAPITYIVYVGLSHYGSPLFYFWLHLDISHDVEFPQF